MTSRHNKATGPYAHHLIKEYVCPKCGLPWKNVKRYDEHRTHDH